MKKAVLLENKHEPGVFRVEATVDDGACEVAEFSGANALERAGAFATSDWYDEWSDETGLYLKSLLFKWKESQ